MFNLNSNLLSGVTSWDTNYARTYLQIPKDQLEKINKIPGWSKASENDKALENIEKQLIQQTSTENILTVNSNTSSKDPLKIQGHVSDSQSKQKFESEKKVFLKNFSLSPLKENTSKNLLKRSNSLPDLQQELQSHNKPEFYRKRVHSLEKDISKFRLSPVLRKNVLNETYTVPLIFNGSIKQDQLLLINHHKSFSCPLEQPSQLPRFKKLKWMDNRNSNDKYLKTIETGEIKCDSGPFSSNGAVQPALKQEMSSFEKKLLLLEKRLSPSKEMSPSPLNEKLINIEDLICEKNQNSSQNFASSDKVSTVIINSDLVENLPDKKQNSSVPRSNESLESQADSQSLKEKKDTFDKDRTTGVSKTATNNFETFLSPEIPCGQPIPTEVPSPPQESAKVNSPNKFQNVSPLVSCGQPLPVEVPSVNPPILSQSIKLNTPSKSQNVNVLDNIKMPEKPSGTFSVFSASSHENVSYLVSNKEMGTKRKRRNKSEKSSKKLDVKKIKRIDIQFSSAQIKNMLEIMKLFHTGV